MPRRRSGVRPWHGRAERRPRVARALDDEYAFSTGGTWRVVAGGTVGDVIQLEAQEVTFGPTLGHDFRLRRMYWRARVEGPRSPPTYDGGGL